MLVNTAGEAYAGDGIGVQRDEALEARLNAELASLDSLLFVKWIQVPINGRMEGRYALCCMWPSSDPRRAWVQAGTHPPEDAYDLFGWFCEDMQNAHSTPKQPEAIWRKALELLYHCDTSRFPWASRMASIAEKNRKLRDKQQEQIADLAHDAAADAYYHSNRAHRVFQSEATHGSKD